MRKRRRSGFTLLEVILSITLSSVIVVIISGGIVFGQKVWKVDKSSDIIDEIESVTRSLKIILEQTYPVVSTEQISQNNDQNILFRGSKNECRFITLSEGSAQWGGLIVFDLFLQTEKSSVNLVTNTSVFRAAEGLSNNSINTRNSVILRNISLFTLSYYGILENNSLPIWTDHWVNRSTLPKLIKLSIGINKNGRTIESSTIISIKQG